MGSFQPLGDYFKQELKDLGIKDFKQVRELIKEDSKGFKQVREHFKEDSKDFQSVVEFLELDSCMELSAVLAAGASEDQEEGEDLMDHQGALIVLSEAASLSPGVDLQAEAARPHHHLTEDLQQQHRPRQEDHLQESRETRAWRLRWPS